MAIHPACVVGSGLCLYTTTGIGAFRCNSLLAASLWGAFVRGSLRVIGKRVLGTGWAGCMQGVLWVVVRLVVGVLVLP